MVLRPGELVLDNQGTEYQVLALATSQEYSEIVLEATNYAYPERFFVFYRAGVNGPWHDRECPSVMLTAKWDDSVGAEPI